MSARSPRRALGLNALASSSLSGSLVAIGLALIAGGLFLEARGKDALAAYELLVRRGLGSSYGLSETLIKTAPVLIVAAGLLIAFRAGVWNIGIDGQVLIGAMLAGVVAPEIAGSAPHPIVWLLGGLAGLLGGVVWAVLPAALKVRWGLNEVITTLMMNYVALNLTAYLVKGPIKDPAVVPQQTRPIPREAMLPDLPGLDVHLGLAVGLVAVALVAGFFRLTTLGYLLDIVGRGRRAAAHAGLPVGGLTAFALLASGGFAGLAGAIDVLGVKGLFQGNWNPAYGFTAFALVSLARLRALWLIPFAAFLSFLTLGGEMMSRPLAIPTAFVQLLEGLMLLFFALAVVIERRGGLGGVRWRRSVAVTPNGETSG